MYIPDLNEVYCKLAMYIAECLVAYSNCFCCHRQVIDCEYLEKYIDTFVAVEWRFRDAVGYFPDFVVVRLD